MVATMAAKTVIPPREARQLRFAQSFARIVAVLMRDPNFRNIRLTDLEWLVLPPILSGQWRVAQARAEQPAANAGATPSGAAPEGNMLVPVAVALWASVSLEIDRRLSENFDKPMLLRPNEWATGNILWLIAVAGDRQAVPRFLKRLADIEFKGLQVKLRAQGPHGKAVIKTLGQVD
jgi:hemolysin-activating ACP:hemolysin acyltransferase